MTEEKIETEAVEKTPKCEASDSVDAPERTIVFEEALEAILFAAGHPVTYATLGRVFNMTPSQVKEKVIDYSLSYNSSDLLRGVVLLTYGDSCQLSTKQYYLSEIRDALGIKKSGTLSTSALETLAIVAYNQPVTRIFVDTLRRVDSSYAMNNLLDRGLIVSKGRLDAPGRPMLYGTTPDFLRVFGLTSIADLPKTTEELEEMFRKVKSTEGEDLAQEEIEFPEGTIPTDSGDGSADDMGEQISIVEFEEPSAEDDIQGDI